MEEIDITIGPDGKVTLRTKGIKGPRCVEAAKVFADIIGKINSSEPTSEYYESEVEVRQHQEQQQHRR